MRVAVIGAGVSGLGAAWQLRDDHDVTLFEREPRLGGHANTRDVPDGTSVIGVDTGFIVHNRRTYPELVALFEELGVPTRATEMSLSVECRECGIQYAGRRPVSLLIGAVRRPSLLPLLLGIRSLLRRARADLARGVDERVTLRQWAEAGGTSERVISHFLVPLAAAVWSAPPGKSLDMPAQYVLGFLDNHGMLSLRRLEWRTVVGGSRTYVDALEHRLRAAGVDLRTATSVAGVTRRPDGVSVRLEDGSEQDFDAVVLATHADHSLAMLDEPLALEQELLGTWRYTTNEAQLHDDPGMLPSQRSARAGWNYRLAGCSAEGPHPTITYFMNRLQGFRAARPWSVSLNARDQVAPEHELYATTYRHPRFDAAAVAAQGRLDELDELARASRTVFCGAWRGFGFHEDGLRSGLAAGRLVQSSLGEFAVPS